MVALLEGCAPTSGSQPPGIGLTIIKGQPNTAWAWTWEVRILHHLIVGRLVLRAVYMTEGSRDDYVDWLWYSPLVDSESSRIHRWVEGHAIVPEQDELVVRAVQDSIALEVVDG